MVEGLFGKKELTRNSQNQITLPAEFREVFLEEEENGRFYIYLEEERSLIFSTLEELKRDLKKGEKLGRAISDRNFMTVFSKNIEMVKMGSDGRITLTKEMMEKAGIRNSDRKVICCGVYNKLELWSVARFNEQIESREVEYRSEKRNFEQEVFTVFPLDGTEDETKRTGGTDQVSD
jgi:division/cell wall cluster transcriptional repressor MraZ